jgi:hypothetical protein
MEDTDIVEFYLDNKLLGSSRLSGLTTEQDRIKIAKLVGVDYYNHWKLPQRDFNSINTKIERNNIIQPVNDFNKYK